MSRISRRKFLQGAAGALGGTIATGGPLAVILAEQHKQEHMVEIRADVNPGIRLWFNGKDVSMQAVACWVHIRPGKTVRGWADFLVEDGQGRIIASDDGPIIYRRHGRVRWESCES